MNLHNIAINKRDNPNKVLNDIIYRWSPRGMNGEVMTADELKPLFEAAHWAPSSFNNQPWRFYYALQGTKEFQILFDLLVEKNQQWCKNAGCLMILVSKTTFDHDRSPMRTHAFDTGAAWHAFAVEGIRRGLVVHGMAGFNYDAAAKVLDLREEYHVNCMIAVGKPAPEVEKETITQRKAINDIAIPYNQRSELL
jgi:nitroreductase